MKKLFFILMLFSQHSYAFLFDDLTKMEGKAILYAGEIKHLSCPYGYDCIKWPSNIYKFENHNYCFTSNMFCSLDCKGILTIEKNTLYLFQINSSGNISSETIIDSYKCPDI